ncbi:MAG: hypothetical protein QW035_04125 [Candidatus Anstonellales archaeon]
MMRSILIATLLIAICFADIKTGQLNLRTDEDIGIILSTGQTYSAEDNVGFQDVDILLQPWDRPAWCANYLKIQGNFDSIAAVPSSGGYFDELNKGAGCDYVEEGVYAIKTRDGKYALVEILEASQLGFSKQYINSITIKYKLQTDGTTSMLPKNARREEGSFCSGAIMAAMGIVLFASIKEFI